MLVATGRRGHLSPLAASSHATFFRMLADKAGVLTLQPSLGTGKPQDVMVFASLDDVKAEVLRIQDEQDQSKTMMDLTRVQPFIEGVEQLGGILRLFASESDVGLLLGHIWGPMQFLLKTASGNQDAFEKLLGAYLDVGNALPPLADSARLFRWSTEMQATLADLYGEILTFHRAVVDLFASPSWSRFFKAAWKDFEPHRLRNGILANIELYRELVASQGPLALGALSPANRQKVPRGVLAYQNKLARQTKLFEAHEARRQYAQKEAVLEWIAATEQTQQTHEMYRQARARYPNLGTWILKNEKVVRWMSLEGSAEEHANCEHQDLNGEWRTETHRAAPDSSMLWITGKQGAGKSFLASLMIDECLRLSGGEQARTPPPSRGRHQDGIRSSRPAVYTAYFYCSSPAASPARSTHLSILQGLLCQLVASFDQLLPSYHAEMMLAGRQTLQEKVQVRVLMGLILESVPRAILIVDGLDEFSPNEARLAAKYLSELVRRCNEQSPGRLRVLVVTGNGGAVSELKRSLAGASVVSIQTEDHAEDLVTLVTSRARDIGTTRGLDEGGRAALVEVVCRRAAGSFLFADLDLSYLDMQGRDGDLTDAIGDGAFPETLEALYHKIINQVKARLDSRPGSLWPKALDLLAWVICPRRTLGWHELQAALGFGSRDEYPSLTPETLGSYVADLCGPLVRVLDGSWVELVHPTAREHILSHPLVDERLMQLHATTLCLRYLRLDCFCRDQMSGADRAMYAREGYLAFQDYATVYWADHLRVLASSSGTDLFTHRRDCAAELDTVLGEFVDGYRLGLPHSPYPDFSQSMAGGGGLGVVGSLGAGGGVCALAGFSFSPKLEHLLSYIFAQESRLGVDNKLLVPQLQSAVRENRKVLEQLLQVAYPTLPRPLSSSSSSLSSLSSLSWQQKHQQQQSFAERPSYSARYSQPDPNLVATLRSYYGPRPYKCAHPGCRYFYTGFDSLARRNTHHDRHDRPFPCPVNDCANGPFGFQSAKDRDRHVRQYHPHESGRLPPFVQPSRRRRWEPSQGGGTIPGPSAATQKAVPILELSSATGRERALMDGRGAGSAVASSVEAGMRLFRCSMCDKSFTRKINLIGHVRSHFGERPFSCGACGKAFARANDCKRHEKIHARRRVAEGGVTKGGGSGSGSGSGLGDKVMMG